MCRYPLKMTKKVSVQNGLTIVELVVAMVISAIVMLGVGFVMADAQKAWGVMYSRAYSDLATDSYVVTKTFDSIVRRACGEKFILSPDGNWVEIYYPADANTVVANRYARFIYEAAGDDSSGRLSVEYGTLTPEKEASDTQVICENVSACVFETSGHSAQMLLTLDDGAQTISIVSSAYMHNQ